MGARIVATTRVRAHASETAEAAPQKAQAGQRSQKNVNSQKESVPKASPDPVNRKKAAARAAVENLDEGDAPPLTTEELIEQQAQIRFVNSAAIDAAIMQAYAGRDRPLTGALLRQKQQVRYTPELWEEIVTRTAAGEALISITQDAHMPTRRSVQRWVIDDPELDREYRAAVLMKADHLAEQAKEMALYGKRRAEMGASSEEVRAIATAASTLQWTAARLSPKVYGDKQSIDLNAKVRMPESQVDARLQFLINKAAKKQADTDEEAEA